MSESQPTFIAQHTMIKGDFHFSGAAVVAGNLEGRVVSEDALEVATEGVIEGDIQGVLVDIQGTVKGNIVASRACRLGASARVTGEIRAANLSFAEGSYFMGQVLVGAEAGQESVDMPVESAAQAVAGSINRLQALTHQVDEMAASAGKPEVVESTPTVRVLTNTVQQSINRSPRIIKAR